MHSICKQVLFSCNNNDRTGFFRQSAGKLQHLRQGLFIDFICHISINTLCCPAAHGHCLNLRNIAAYRCKFYFPQQLKYRFRTQCRSASAYRVQNHRMPQGICLFACFHHCSYSAFIQGTDIDHQTVADRSNILYLLRLIGHNGGSTARQHNIGTIVHRHIVSNTMHQRLLLLHLL